MQGEYHVVPMQIVCGNCATKITAWRDSKGIAKAKCPYCGTVMVSKLKSRKHIQLDMYKPTCQEILR